IELHDGAITIGAGVTHAEVARSAVLRERLPVLADLAGHIGGPAVRPRGTPGGALAGHALAGGAPPCRPAPRREAHPTNPEVAATEFFVGPCRTVLEPGEIITAVTFPVARQSAYVKFLNPASRYAMVGVFAAVVADGSPRIAVTGARACGAFRWREAETALSTAVVAERLRDVHLSPEGLVGDLFGGSGDPRHLSEVPGRRAVALATGPSHGALVLSHGSQFGTGGRQQLIQ